MKTYVFPGQGSQARGMGGELFDQYASLTEKADKILGYSIKDLCLNDPDRVLNKTQYTQPALYVVNALSYLKIVDETGEKPDFVAGHSLGEFNALFAAGCFDFEAGLKMVKRRGELMSEAPAGGMAAILNASKDEIIEILKVNKLDNIDLANFNTLSQIVISGSREEVGAAQKHFQTGKILYYPLNTSGAFHSRFMDPIRSKYEPYLKKFKLNEPEIPVISNYTAEPYAADAISTNLSMQLSNCVRWADSIIHLLGIDPNMEFVEVGHGEVLTKIITKLKTEVSEQETSKDKENASKVEAAEVTTKKASDKQAPAESNSQDATSKVSDWNKKFPVGSKVKSTLGNYEELVTRTEAVVLFGHRAAVYMKDYKGYFDLDELTPA